MRHLYWGLIDLDTYRNYLLFIVIGAVAVVLVALLVLFIKRKNRKKYQFGQRKARKY